jgi:hypothetical protein
VGSLATCHHPYLQLEALAMAHSAKRMFLYGLMALEALSALATIHHWISNILGA